jgi:hypothetical protein
MNSALPLSPLLTDPQHRAIAPAWHTAVILIVLFAFSFAGAHAGRAAPGGAYGRIPGYLVIIAIEWAMVAFIWFGIRRRGLCVADLVQGNYTRFIHVLRDLGMAVLFLILSGLVLGTLGYLLKARPNEAIRGLFPQTPAEIVVYLMLTMTAGFCEEFIFRGYLQRQFAALTHATAGGIVLQGIVFGAAHGYQGWRYMLMIAVFGIMFGLLAQKRRSLRPGMIAHFLQDTMGGLVGRHLLR